MSESAVESNPSAAASNFVREIVEEDIRQGKAQGRQYARHGERDQYSLGHINRR